MMKMSIYDKYGKPTICLAMIVKDEKHIIGRLLDSVKNHIDYVLVCDTGSTDGTQQYCRDILDEMDVAQAVVDVPWVDFGFNRSQALELARTNSECDYTLMLDADEELEEVETEEQYEPGKDVYSLAITLGNTVYHRRMVFSNKIPWRYEGVLHEYPTCDTHATVSAGFIPSWRVKSTHAGARSKDKDLYKRDAAVLQRALIDDPDNSRYVFYLAQSYFDAKDWLLAERYYRQRLDMGGYAEEVWFSLKRLGEIAEQTVSEGSTVAQQYYMDCYAADPSRAEPMYRLGMIYVKAKKWALAEMFMGRACLIPEPKNRLFVAHDVYAWRRLLEYAVILHYCGMYKDSIAVSEKLLDGDTLPSAHAEQVRKNISFSKDALERLEPSGPTTALED